jgi:uncharacterized protein (DUF58 family)
VNATAGGPAGPVRFRRLKPTRDGWYFCVLTLGTGLAALNTGNNLLFLVFGLLLSTIILSGILSERSLQGIAVYRDLPSDPCAGDAFTVGIRVRNRKKYWPSYALEFREPDGPVAGSETRALLIRPGEEVALAYVATALTRGRFVLWRLEVRTRFPFGLFEKIRDVGLESELWVLPRRVNVAERWATGGPQDGSRPEGRAGTGEELLGLVDLRPGDDRRSVHWRKSAAVGRLLRIERERERRRRILVVLDNRRRLSVPAFEDAVSQAASYVRRLADRGIETGLSTSGSLHPPGGGPLHQRRLLRTLAELDLRPDGPPPAEPRSEATLRIGESGADAA